MAYILMVYSYLTHSKQAEYYLIVFTEGMNSDNTVAIHFLPMAALPFAKGNIELHNIKHRELNMILYNLELYGMTLIVTPEFWSNLP